MREPNPQRRLTIVDLAEELGLSVASVSYALNGKPGVSEATRQRVLAASRERGWRASHAARSLQARRSGVIGLVRRHQFPRETVFSDFLMRFIDGMAEQLILRPESLLFEPVDTLEAELETYRAWAGQGRVDALALTDVLDGHDPRLALLEELGLPTVVVGDVRGATRLPSVWTDDAEAMRITIEHLAERGHRRIARMSDGGGLRHLELRSRAFRESLEEAGLDAGPVMLAGLGQRLADEQLAAVMAQPDHPTAFQYDNAVRAAEGMKALRGLGYRIPEECAVVCWDNSVVCEVTDPQLSSIDRDAFDYGGTVARRILQLLDTGTCLDTRGTVSHLVHRGSS